GICERPGRTRRADTSVLSGHARATGVSPPRVVSERLVPGGGAIGAPGSLPAFRNRSLPGANRQRFRAHKGDLAAVSAIFGDSYASAYDLIYQEKDYNSECALLESVFR